MDRLQIDNVNDGRVAQSAALPLMAIKLFCLRMVGVVALLVTLSGPGSAEAKMNQEDIVLVTQHGEQTISVEIAQTTQEKSLGLMFRTELADKAGMLFVYKRDQEIGMWMKNTYIPLDMVFIRANGVVHRIVAYTEPFSEATVLSKGPVRYVLELAGGAATRLGLKTGDHLRHRLFAH